ncbi:transcription factor bHLH153 [Magnolia sinica]|uniref:transcription factor bHLH153 n=1 Tax=Magnolia sinica TaxID=86752 RepID=UPI00265B6FED|nr:transcription factor bHLH153 [Magnolia sinica]
MRWRDFTEEGPVDTMTELKRQLGTVDHNGTICSPMKRHRTQGPISTRERKDKVGERISALQELVSPYGKTDTASVLLEAMEYIKFLQDQVRVLSAPYLQNTPQPMVQESEYYNLRSRGLCLVPVEWTVRVARSNGADMWAPTMTPTNQ